MTSLLTAHPPTAPPHRRRPPATERLTPFPSLSIGSLQRNLMPTPESCSRRSMAAWRTATSIVARSIPRLGFASASEKPTDGEDDRHHQSGLHLYGEPTV